MTARQHSLIFRFAPRPEGNVADMRIRKVIDKDGVNAAISVNVNEPGRVTAESGTELPDREGTYDELREEATKKVEEERATEGEQDG
jgi:hypothetical protein